MDLKVLIINISIISVNLNNTKNKLNTDNINIKYQQYQHSQQHQTWAKYFHKPETHINSQEQYNTGKCVSG